MTGIDVQNEAVRGAIAAEVAGAVFALEGDDAAVPEIQWDREGSAGRLYFVEPVCAPHETRRLVRALHHQMTPRLGELSLAHTIWYWGAERLLNETGDDASKLSLYRPESGSSAGQELHVGVVELPVNLGSNGWRGLSLQFSGHGSAPEFVQGEPVVVWPYASQVNAARADTSLTNNLRFKELPDGTEESLQSWLIDAMNDAEPMDRMRQRRKTAEAQLAATGNPIEETYAELFPGKEFPGLFAKFEIISALVHAAWAADHPGAN